MPHGVTTLLFVLLAGLLVAVARGQSDYYDQYLDTQVKILHLVSEDTHRMRALMLINEPGTVASTVAWAKGRGTVSQT